MAGRPYSQIFYSKEQFGLKWTFLTEMDVLTQYFHDNCNIRQISVKLKRMHETRRHRGANDQKFRSPNIPTRSCFSFPAGFQQFSHALRSRHNVTLSHFTVFICDTKSPKRTPL